MKLSRAIEGGLAGASTLSLLQEALHKIDHKAPRPLFHQSGIIKKIKKKSGKDRGKLYIKLAGELVSNAAYFGLTSLGKKKNAVLRGGLLGAAAGLGSAFLRADKDKEFDGIADNSEVKRRKEAQRKILTVALYTAGGLLAGAAIKKAAKKKKKK